MTTEVTTDTAAYLEQAERYGAHNYHPLPIVVAEAQGAWVTDVEGRRYLDCLAAYSALNFGHGHPLLIAAAAPGPGWFTAVIAIAALGVLGAGLATVVLGNRLRWATALVLGGVIVTAVGAWLKIA